MPFQWVAKLRNGSVIRQSEGAVFSRDVVPRAQDVVSVFLDRGSKRYGVNLLTGDILFDAMYLKDFHVELGAHAELEYGFSDLAVKDELTDIRQIFFRRTTRVFSLEGGSSPFCFYVLSFLDRRFARYSLIGFQ